MAELGSDVSELHGRTILNTGVYIIGVIPEPTRRADFHAGARCVCVGYHPAGGQAAPGAVSTKKVVARLALQAGSQRGADDAFGVTFRADVDGHIIEVVLLRTGKHAGEVGREAPVGDRALLLAVSRGQVGEPANRGVADGDAGKVLIAGEVPWRTAQQASPVPVEVVELLLPGTSAQATASDWVGVGHGWTGSPAGGRGILGEVARGTKVDAPAGGGIGVEGPPAISDAVEGR